MVTIWISASLLALTGWQGYRLGREYGWWGRDSASSGQAKKRQPVPAPEPLSSAPAGLGRSRTDVSRLLAGYEAAPDSAGNATPVMGLAMTTDAGGLDEPVVITEPTTTLSGMADVSHVITKPEDYPDATDQVPATCDWLDDEAMPLLDQDDTSAGEPVPAEGIPYTQYVRRVRTVQRKLNDLTQRRRGDSDFVKQELAGLIQTYRLENDQSVAWLFEAQAATTGVDYGSLFDGLDNNPR